VASRGVEVVVAGGLLVVVGFGVGALGAVAGRVGDFVTDIFIPEISAEK